MPSSSTRTVFRLLPLLTVGAIVTGCASYGTFDENEPGLEESLLGDITTVIGGQTNDQEIEYSTRPPLVAPPEAAALPAPQSQQAVAAADPNWPTGSRERMAQVLQNEDQMLIYTPGVDGVDIEATQALAARSSQSGQTESNSGVDRPLTLAEMQREQEIELARQQGRAVRDAQAVTRERRFLTDPPTSARAPSAEAPYGAEAEELAEAEQSGGFSWWPF
ncbi:MAG: hypothetical protein AAGH43_04260 [Pseudomonadota bacterium]